MSHYKETVRSLLINYLVRVPGLTDSDCHAEVASIADEIESMVKDEVKQATAAIAESVPAEMKQMSTSVAKLIDGKLNDVESEIKDNIKAITDEIDRRLADTTKTCTDAMDAVLKETRKKVVTLGRHVDKSVDLVTGAVTTNRKEIQKLEEKFDLLTADHSKIFDNLKRLNAKVKV